MNRSLPLLSLAVLTQLACGVGPPVVGGRAHAMNHQVEALQACAGSTVVQGVDVSGYDDTVDWHAAAAGGLVFGIARISDGISYPDPYFQANWAGMADAGIIRGAYQFFEAGDDITTEANVVVQAVGQLGPNDLPVVIDIEEEPDGDVPTVEQIQTWMGVVEQGTGKLPMIYCGEGYWNENFGSQFSSNPLWVANWDVTCPAMPTGWTMWNIWQYSATGNAPGVTNSPNAADLDEFNGSTSDLLAFAQQSAVSCGASSSTCSADTDCCLGLTCQSSTCQAPTCTTLDSACTDASQCCSGLTCLVWTPSGSDPGTYCCDGVGASCSDSRECCGGNLCEGGTCVCVPANTYCQNDIDCCAGLSCQSGLCQTAPSSASSSSSSTSSSSSSGTVATTSSGATVSTVTSSSSSGAVATAATSSSGVATTSTSATSGTTGGSSSTGGGPIGSSSASGSATTTGFGLGSSTAFSGTSSTGTSSGSAKSGGCSSAPGQAGEWLSLLAASVALGGRRRRWSRG